MAEPIGVASGLVALAGFAFKSSVTLYQTVHSFRNHPKDVRDLLGELEALAGVLQSLTETVSAITDFDFSPLNKPLLRCGHACLEFEQELMKCLSNSGGDKLTFRGWARLKYISGNVDAFRHSLAGYKSTITVALADVNLRKSSATAEQLESYRDLVKSTTDDLEAHLQRIDNNFEVLLQQAVPEAGSVTAEMQLIKDERASTKNCLDICAQLSDHISQIRVTSEDDQQSTGQRPMPAKLTNEGLQVCKDGLSAASEKLEGYMKDVLDRLVAQSRTTMAPGDVLVDLARLQEEWETTRQCQQICNKVSSHIETSVSIIENHGTGDSVQFMVSTDGQVLHGTNRGLGWRNRQIGGHLSNESVQQLSRDMLSVNIARTDDNNTASRNMATTHGENAREQRSESDFGKRYGPGSKLEN